LCNCVTINENIKSSDLQIVLQKSFGSWTRWPSEHVCKHINIYCCSYRSHTLRYLHSKQLEKKRSIKIKIQRLMWNVIWFVD
jgi:hypothetical protein